MNNEATLYTLNIGNPVSRIVKEQKRLSVHGHEFISL